MALVGGWTNGQPDSLTCEASADALRRAGRIFRASGNETPLTMDHQLDVFSDISLPEQLCRDLRLGRTAGDEVHELIPEHDQDIPIYPCTKIIYNVPLSDRLLDGASLFQFYRALHPALRVHLAPLSRGGDPAPYWAIQVVGIRVAIPQGISRVHQIQEHLFSLLGQASRKRLKVLACNIDNIEDFAWLRTLPDVLFQGGVLSIPLSLGYVQDWLAEAGSAWSNFHLGH